MRKGKAVVNVGQFEELRRCIDGPALELAETLRCVEFVHRARWMSFVPIGFESVLRRCHSHFYLVIGATKDLISCLHQRNRLFNTRTMIRTRRASHVSLCCSGVERYTCRFNYALDVD